MILELLIVDRLYSMCKKLSKLTSPGYTGLLSPAASEQRFYAEPMVNEGVRSVVFAISILPHRGSVARPKAILNSTDGA